MRLKACKAPECDNRQPRDKMLGPMKEFCSVDCGYALQQHKRREKAEKDRRHMRQVRLKHKSDKARAQAIDNAESAVNAFVRVRDHGLPCISCGQHKPHTAGHHKSVASSPEIRFNTKNINGQCSFCNQGHILKFHDPTIAEKYADGVRRRYGQQRLDWVNGPHETKKYTVEDLNRIRRLFNRRSRHYKKLRGIE